MGNLEKELNLVLLLYLFFGFFTPSLRLASPLHLYSFSVPKLAFKTSGLVGSLRNPSLREKNLVSSCSTFRGMGKIVSRRLGVPRSVDLHSRRRGRSLTSRRFVSILWCRNRNSTEWKEWIRGVEGPMRYEGRSLSPSSLAGRSSRTMEHEYTNDKSKGQFEFSNSSITMGEPNKRLRFHATGCSKPSWNFHPLCLLPVFVLWLASLCLSILLFTLSGQASSTLALLRSEKLFSFWVDLNVFDIERQSSAYLPGGKRFYNFELEVGGCSGSTLTLTQTLPPGKKEKKRKERVEVRFLYDASHKLALKVSTHKSF